MIAKKLKEGIHTINSILSKVPGVTGLLPSGECSRAGSSRPVEERSNLFILIKAHLCNSEFVCTVGDVPKETGPCSQALRSVTRRITGNRQCEHRQNFAPYAIKKASSESKGKGKQKEWVRGCSFKTVCLSSPQDAQAPCSASQKEVLSEPGRGEKIFYVPDCHLFKGWYHYFQLSQVVRLWWVWITSMHE